MPDIFTAIAATASPTFFISLLLGTLTFSSPLLLAALGGLFSERSGVVNIGLEGKMLAAACAAGLVSTASASPFVGILAALATATALSILHWTFTQTFRVDHIISGMGLNAIAAGATSLVAKRFPEIASERMPALPVAAYWVAAWTAVVAVWFLLRQTRPGLHLLAVGENPDKARQMGLQPFRVRLNALLATGTLTGLAGALIASNAGSFSDGMTSGRGYIALAALILAGWKPVPALVACLMFGFFEALQLQLQGVRLFGQVVPGELWQALPYIVTLLALAGLLGKNRPPAGLGKP